MVEKAAETGSRRGTAGSDRDLGSRSKAESQQAQRRAVEDGGSGPLSRWTFGPITEEGGESGAKSGSDQSQGDGWGGIQDTGGDGEDPEYS